jgi:hypothetical protein
LGGFVESPFITESGRCSTRRMGSTGARTGISSGSLNPRHVRGLFPVTCGSLGRIARIESSGGSTESRGGSPARWTSGLVARDVTFGGTGVGGEAVSVAAAPLSVADPSARALSSVALSAAESSRARHAANTAATITAAAKNTIVVRIGPR